MIGGRRWGSRWRAGARGGRRGGAPGLATHPPLVLPLRERVAMAKRLYGVASVDETAELVGVSRWTVYGYWKAVRCGGCGGWQVNPGRGRAWTAARAAVAARHCPGTS
jgi:hypothetical protein